MQYDIFGDLFSIFHDILTSGKFDKLYPGFSLMDCH